MISNKIVFFSLERSQGWREASNRRRTWWSSGDDDDKTQVKSWISLSTVYGWYGVWWILFNLEKCMNDPYLPKRCISERWMKRTCTICFSKWVRQRRIICNRTSFSFFTNRWHFQKRKIWTKLLFAEHGWIDRGDKEPLAVPEPVSIFPTILSTFCSTTFVFFALLYWLLSYLILWVYYHLTCLWNVHALQHQLLSSQYCFHHQIIFFSNSPRCRNSKRGGMATHAGVALELGIHRPAAGGKASKVMLMMLLSILVVLVIIIH